MRTKTILITGGTGTFGKAFIKKFHNDFKKVIVFSRDEFKQSVMQDEFKNTNVEFIIGDLRDYESVDEALKKSDIVIHAGAMKQVPTCEFFPEEAIKTNVLGTINVVKSFCRNNKEKLIVLSTDKAVSPINLYGATKMCGEKLVLNYQNNYNNKISCVRYGNVIGSRGSLFSLFNDQIKSGSIKITHPEMTRFWITVDGAITLVRDVLEVMEGGEVFVPKLKSCRILDLVNIFYQSTKIEFTGIREGEKINETLISIDESIHNTISGEKYFVLKKKLFRTSVSEKGLFEYSSNQEENLLTKREDMVKEWGLKND